MLIIVGPESSHTNRGTGVCVICWNFSFCCSSKKISPLSALYLPISSQRLFYFFHLLILPLYHIMHNSFLLGGTSAKNCNPKGSLITLVYDKLKIEIVLQVVGMGSGQVFARWAWNCYDGKTTGRIICNFLKPIGLKLCFAAVFCFLLSPATKPCGFLF